MPAIELNSLVKRYGDVEVLHGIELEMADNEFTVLVGPSGCGKSTTLRMIAGLEDVSAGEIYVDGKPVSHLEPKDRDLAMVFQDYALYPHMNVAQNISFALRLARRPKAEIDAKVREVAATVGLTDFLHRKPGALSGGQRQRVAMARALAKDSSIFLFDEPLSNLDAKLRGQMRAELAIMRQRVREEHDLRHPRPDRGDDARRPDRRDAWRTHPAAGHAGRAVQAPGQQVRRRVFLGTPPDELSRRRAGDDRRHVLATGAGLRMLAAIPGEKAAAALTAFTESQPGHPGHPPVGPPSSTPSRGAPTKRRSELKVKVSEYIGAQSVLLCACGGAEVTVELKSETPIAAWRNPALLRSNPEGIHLFDQAIQKQAL